MFARITRTEARPEDIDGAPVKYDQETLFPTLRKINGFKGAYVLVDRATGRGLTYDAVGERDRDESERGRGCQDAREDANKERHHLLASSGTKWRLSHGPWPAIG